MSTLRAARSASAEYLQFVEVSRRISAIDLRAYKPTQMERRLRSLLARKQIGGFAPYAELIARDRENRLEFERYVTINVTQFYRDPVHFNELEQALRRRVRAAGPLRVWSAGCSNGSEPYTVAMILATIAPGLRHQIHGTDIDEASLCQARLGSGYSHDDLATLPDAYRSKFVTLEAGRDTFAISPVLRAMVTFSRHDLIAERHRSGYDLILCRNVVIYFSHATKYEIFSGFFKSLNPGGLLFIGASEMLTGLREIGYVQQGHGLYQRPEGTHGSARAFTALAAMEDRNG